LIPDTARVLMGAMQSPRIIVVALGLVICAACTRGTNDGLVIRQRNTSSSLGAAPREVTIYVSGKTRVDDSERMRKIIDLDAKTITTVYKDKRTYTRRSFEQLRAQAAAVQKRLDALPAQARDLISVLAPKDGTLTVTPTGKVEKIAGFEANEYALKGGGVSAGSVWMGEGLDVPREGRDWEVLNMSLGGLQAPDQRLAAAIEHLNGFPLRVQMTAAIGSQTLTLSTETLEVKRESVPADVLRVPDGFTQVEVPGMAKSQ